MFSINYFQINQYSPYQFSIFRIVLGVYLTIHFAMLIPYAPELFGASGVLPDSTILPTYSFFPNLLFWFDDLGSTVLFLTALTLLSIFYTLGIYRRTASLLLWYGWACLLNRNIFISNPGIPYIGWLLLASCLIPLGEPLALQQKRQEEPWQFPLPLFWGAWCLMGLGYSVSGIHKLGSPSWINGTALSYLLENPLARDWWLRDVLLTVPDFLLHGMTLGVLALEIFALPLFLWHVTRKWAWLGFVGMHIGIMLVIDFADLTLGMLMIHWFTFDPRWLPQTSHHKATIFFDGICGFCNRFIAFLVQEDRNRLFSFAPLQGTTAHTQVGQMIPKQPSSILIKTEHGIYQKSDAVIKIFEGLGGIWRLAGVFRLIPRSLRDGIYTLIAKHRYRLLGQNEQCRLYPPEEASRFLP